MEQLNSDTTRRRTTGVRRCVHCRRRRAWWHCPMMKLFGEFLFTSVDFEMNFS